MENILELYVNGGTIAPDTIGKIDLYGDEPINLNISIADIKDISKRNSTFSQNFTIPATKNNNVLLNHIFNIGSDASFDPRKKTSCYMLNDYIQVFSGNLQLISIKVLDMNVISYTIVVYGEVFDVVKTLGDKLLSDLDFSELNHTYNVDNIESSWYANTKTLGYYYPLIDYGFDLSLDELNSGQLSVILANGIATSGTTNTLVDTSALWPINGFIGKNISIVDGAGVGQVRTVLSNTLTTITLSTPWTSAIDNTSKYNVTQIDISNPAGSTGNGMSPLLFRPALSNTYLLNKMFTDAGVAIDSPFIESDIIAETIIPYNGDSSNVLSPEYMKQYSFRTSLGTNMTFASGTPSASIIQFSDDSTPPNFDTNNLFDTSTKRYTADRVCAMTFVLNLRCYFTGSSINDPKKIGISFYRQTGSSPAVPFSDHFITINTPLLNLDYYYTIESAALDNPLSTLNLTPLQPGDEVFVVIGFIGGGTHTCVVVNTDTFMYNKPIPKILSGMDLQYNEFIPKNIKQIDYFKSIINMFNLMVISDKSNAHKIQIIPRNDYFASGVVKDWTNKLDVSQQIEETLISEQQNKLTLFTYKEDKDFYNVNYKDNTNTIYGQYKFILDNEWIEGVKKIETIFSPTPIDKVYGTTNIFIPKIAKRDEKSGIYGRTDFNIRFLRKNKVLEPTVDTIRLQGKSPINGYPYAGHLDHPVNANIDYNFGPIKYAYYDELNSLTPNNLIETYWRQYLNDIEDKNSKLIKCKIYLTPNDINLFDYNDTIFLNGLTDDGGHYFTVNKITYSPTSNLPSLVELIKTTKKAQMLLERRALNPIHMLPRNALILGGYNTSESGVNIINGRNNNVGFNSDGSVIFGNNNTIANNTPGVVLINTNDRYIDTPFVTIVGNTYFYPDGTSTPIYNDIDSGEDLVVNPFATNAYNDIESGLDDVLNYGSTSPIKDIDSLEDRTSWFNP